MKRFLRSKLILSLVTVVLLASAIIVPLAGNLFRAHAQAPAPITLTKSATTTASGSLIYHNGPVMQSTSTIYAIFWEPPKLPDGTSTYVSTNYNSLIQRYFNDVGGSGLYNNNTQYYQITKGITNYIVNNSTLGGAWIDTSPYPSPSDCTDPALPHGCMTDLDIQKEVKGAMSTNGWTGGLTHLFYVFTSWGEGVCNSSNLSQCSLNPGGFCGYHTNFSNNGTILYAYIPYLGTISNSAGCSVPQSPNNDLDADRAINGASHEQMDAVTDPLGTAWFDSKGNALGEIADKCIEQFGSVTLDGGKANVQLNGDYYIVQQEWSNTNNSCVTFFPPYVYFGSSDSYIYSLNAADGTLRWRFKTGSSVYSSPAVVNGVVYISSQDSNVYALNASNGSLRWRYQTGSGITGSPTVINGVVYIGSNDFYVYALNASNGSLRWRFKTNGDVESQPAVVNGVVYIGSGYPGDTSVYALNASNGSLRWRYQTGSSVYSSPAVINGVVYIGSNDTYLYALNASNGSLRWRYQTGEFGLSSPAVANGVVYVDSGAVNNGYLFALNASNGSLIWQSPSDGNSYGAPAVVNGVVYTSGGNSVSYAFNASNGSPLWQQLSGALSEPTVKYGVVYVGTHSGISALLATDGSLLWSYQPGNNTYLSP